ncbi:MAG: cellulase family glycosylhydrolase [Pseudomonadota bacterium]
MTPSTLDAPGPLSTRGNQIIDSTGTAVEIRAVNWFGLESDIMTPHGLWARNWQDMMDQMVETGFNAIRLPFSHEAIDANSRPGNGIDFGLNPDLVGLNPLQIIDKVVDYADEVGLKIILDHHRSDSGAGPNGNGLWYTPEYSEAEWIEMWELLAARYGDSPAVIGADLHNEPHGAATWGGGGANDWARAAEAAGNAVLAVASDWLVFVEGVGQYEGQPYWWGGSLAGVRDRPIELDVAGRLVYSPHDYPASVFNQPWFNDGSNLYEVFRENWGFIFEEGIAPIFLGEFGSRLTEAADLPWAEAITSYLAGDFDGDGDSDLADGDAGMSFAWWSWNPNSGDTGGILNDDWTTLRQNAIDLLAPLLSSENGVAPAIIETGSTTDGVDVSADGQMFATLEGQTVSDDDVAFDFGDFDQVSYALAGTASGPVGVLMAAQSNDNMLLVAASGQVDGANVGVRIEGVGHTIENAGRIAGGQLALDMRGSEGVSVLNTGTIEVPSGTAVRGGVGSENIENSGEILGSIGLSGGDDVYNAKGDGSSGVVRGGRGEDMLRGGALDDMLRGGGGNDKLNGRAGDDQLVGGSGNDMLRGKNGADDLRAGKGEDVVSGGGGRDQIDGGRSNDILTGNGGADRFVFGVRSGDDVITDFISGLDRIDIRALDVSDTADLRAAISRSGPDTVVDLDALGGNGSITLSGGDAAVTDFVL